LWPALRSLVPGLGITVMRRMNSRSLRIRVKKAVVSLRRYCKSQIVYICGHKSLRPWRFPRQGSSSLFESQAKLITVSPATCGLATGSVSTERRVR
jgi:hypothetical protein